MVLNLPSWYLKRSYPAHPTNVKKDLLKYVETYVMLQILVSLNIGFWFL